MVHLELDAESAAMVHAALSFAGKYHEGIQDLAQRLLPKLQFSLDKNTTLAPAPGRVAAPINQA